MNEYSTEFLNYQINNLGKYIEIRKRDSLYKFRMSEEEFKQQGWPPHIANLFTMEVDKDGNTWITFKESDGHNRKSHKKNEGTGGQT